MKWLRDCWSCMKSVDHSIKSLLIMHEILYIHIIMSIIATPTWVELNDHVVVIWSNFSDTVAFCWAILKSLLVGLQSASSGKELADLTKRKPRIFEIQNNPTLQSFVDLRRALKRSTIEYNWWNLKNLFHLQKSFLAKTWSKYMSRLIFKIFCLHKLTFLSAVVVGPTFLLCHEIEKITGGTPEVRSDKS